MLPVFIPYGKSYRIWLSPASGQINVKKTCSEFLNIKLAKRNNKSNKKTEEAMLILKGMGEREASPLYENSSGSCVDIGVYNAKQK